MTHYDPSDEDGDDGTGIAWRVAVLLIVIVAALAVAILWP